MGDAISKCCAKDAEVHEQRDESDHGARAPGFNPDGSDRFAV